MEQNGGHLNITKQENISHLREDPIRSFVKGHKHSRYRALIKR